jgi:hypothetical protein
MWPLRFASKFRQLRASWGIPRPFQRKEIYLNMLRPLDERDLHRRDNTQIVLGKQAIQTARFPISRRPRFRVNFPHVGLIDGAVR